MPALFDYYIDQLQENKLQLETFIKANNNRGVLYVVSAFLLMLIGVAATGIFIQYCNKNTGCSWHDELNTTMLYCAVSFALLCEIGGIICLGLSKNCNSSADKYRNELVILRDLFIAIEIADMLEDDITKTIPNPNKDSQIATIETKESERTNARQEIITTLLNRCN